MSNYLNFTFYWRNFEQLETNKGKNKHEQLFNFLVFFKIYNLRFYKFYDL